MILSDRDIHMFLANGSIDIEPYPEPCAFSSTSLDLRLDDQLRCFEAHVDASVSVLDPASPGYVYETAISRVTSKRRLCPAGYDLLPQSMVLGWTMERITLDVMSRIAARVEGKSSLARLGLAIHITAPTVHAGFSGVIQLEIVNHGPLPIRLRKSMKICQLIFEQAMSVPQKGYQGQFQHQSAGAPSSKRTAKPLMHKSPVRESTGLCESRAIPGGA